MDEVITALKYLAGFYGWNDEDKKDIWASTKDEAEMQQHWILLAEAHKAGYRQTAENGYIRLHAWLAQRGENAAPA